MSIVKCSASSSGGSVDDGGFNETERDRVFLEETRIIQFEQIRFNVYRCCSLSRFGSTRWVKRVSSSSDSRRFPWAFLNDGWELVLDEQDSVRSLRGKKKRIFFFDWKTERTFDCSSPTLKFRRSDRVDRPISNYNFHREEVFLDWKLRITSTMTKEIDRCWETQNLRKQNLRSQNVKKSYWKWNSSVIQQFEPVRSMMISKDSSLMDVEQKNSFVFVFDIDFERCSRRFCSSLEIFDFDQWSSTMTKF